MFKLQKCNSKFLEQKVSKSLTLQLNTHQKINKSCWLSLQMDKKLNLQQLVLLGKMKQVKFLKKSFNYQLRLRNFYLLLNWIMKSSTHFIKITHYQMKSSINWTLLWKFQKEWDQVTTLRKLDLSYRLFVDLNVEPSHHLITFKWFMDQQPSH